MTIQTLKPTPTTTTSPTPTVVNLPWDSVLIEPDDIVVSGFNHAEQNIINCALQSEQDLISIAAGRPICPTCFEEILKMVGTVIASQVK
jgi:hypothetical protein